MEQELKTISLKQIAAAVNNINLEEEVLIFEGTFNNINRVFPLRFDALIVMMIERGSGKIGINLQEYDIQKNSFVIIYPQCFVHLLDVSEDTYAKVVVCAPSALEDILPKLTDLMPLLLQNSAHPVLQFSDEEYKITSCLYESLKCMLHSTKTQFLRAKVVCLLQAIFYETLDRSRQMEMHNPQTRKQEIMSKFLLELTKNFRTERGVAFYAHLLCITPKHLSAVIKEISGRTAGEWIERYVITEAKVLLKSTDLSMKEISDALNFSNQSFFGKYFRQQTGVSPSVYRKVNTTLS
jgi:AraC-like DNA-binding protein